VSDVYREKRSVMYIERKVIRHVYRKKQSDMYTGRSSPTRIQGESNPCRIQREAQVKEKT
jgi:hypothetical protein